MTVGNTLLGVHVDLSAARDMLAQDVFAALGLLGASIARGVLAWSLAAAPLALVLYVSLKPFVSKALRAAQTEKDADKAH
jgi:hypothetical protein